MNIQPLKSKSPSQIRVEFEEWFATTSYQERCVSDGLSQIAQSAAYDAWVEVEKRQLQKRYESAYNSILMETKGT